MTDAVITYEQLQNAKACRDQLVIFKRKFGERVEVTVEMAESVADEFHWDWAAENLLTEAALAECKRAIAPAKAEYERAMATALAEYNRAKATAWDEYDRAKATAWDEYNRATAAAWAEYKRAIAPAFATAYIAQERDDD